MHDNTPTPQPVSRLSYFEEKVSASIGVLAENLDVLRIRLSPVLKSIPDSPEKADDTEAPCEFAEVFERLVRRVNALGEEVQKLNDRLYL